MKAFLFDIQRFSVHDGPGIRTTVFFSGCSLSCRWCHNPEGLKKVPVLRYERENCISCGRCGGSFDASAADLCPTGAKHLCGREMTVDDIMKTVSSDRDFYGEEGGVTLSGGECLLQSEAAAALLSRAKEAGIHTAVDTAGNVPWEAFARTLDACDLYLYDIKCADPDRHRAFCGDSNERILDNLFRLSDTKKPLWLRVPVIPGFNDTDEEMTAIAAIAAQIPNARRVTLIPYHSLGADKYRALGRTYPYADAVPPAKDRMQRFSAIFTAMGLPVEASESSRKDPST